MARRTLRLPDELNVQVAEAARERGFTSATAFIRAALTEALTRNEAEKTISAMEERLAASLQRQFQKLSRGQQAGIALTDALAQLLLSSQTGPELVKERHQEYLRAAAASLKGSLVKALEEIQ